MSAPVTTGKRGEQARARLGQQGLLSSNLYQIQFHQTFVEAEKRGIRKAHVEQAIHQPDSLQHVLPEKIRSEDFPAISVYAKHHGTSHSTDRFTLLVPTLRRGATQIVSAAWRVYHSDVDLADAHEPLDVLRAFVGTYGINFRVGNSPLRKFFFYEAFPLMPGGQRTDITRIEAANPLDVASMSFLRVSSLGVIEVAIAYVIDRPPYINDLRKHGVQFRS
jgi:hypothetical protein